MITTSPHRHTPEEYLTRERHADVRSEYIDGQIVTMPSGASRPHNLIVSALSGSIGEQLQDGPCEVYINDMRVKVSASGDYLYPDLAVSCDPEFENRICDSLLSPVLIIDVLSDSTEGYDRRKKFGIYRQIESLREYVLVSQNEPRAERHVRQGDSWHFSSVDGLDASLALASIRLEVPMKRLYEKAVRPTQRVPRAVPEDG
jgi:Uma2 family endonuclease